MLKIFFPNNSGGSTLRITRVGKRVTKFLKGISQKMNVRLQLEFEHAYFEFADHLFSQ